ncbi:MAG: response regulator transcription factor [Actinomycetota bacterium]
MRGRQKVLVVEDNLATRTMISEMLEIEGYEVAAVADGSEVVGTLTESVPALVILDIMLPGLSGFEVLKQIRDADTTRDLPVLMLTALDDADSTWKGWTGGCDYYMTKPFDTEDLLSVVHNLTSGVAA